LQLEKALQRIKKRMQTIRPYWTASIQDLLQKMEAARRKSEPAPSDENHITLNLAAAKFNG